MHNLRHSFFSFPATLFLYNIGISSFKKTARSFPLAVFFSGMDITERGPPRCHPLEVSLLPLRGVVLALAPEWVPVPAPVEAPALVLG